MIKPSDAEIDATERYIFSPSVSILIVALSILGSIELAGPYKKVALGITALASANHLWVIDRTLKKLRADINELKRITSA